VCALALLQSFSFYQPIGGLFWNCLRVLQSVRGHSAFVLTVAINGNKNLMTAFRENFIHSPEKIRLSDYVRFVLLAGDDSVVTSGMRYGVLWTITKEILKRKLLPTFSK
jgi:hypothetical protein